MQADSCPRVQEIDDFESLCLCNDDLPSSFRVEDLKNVDFSDGLVAGWGPQKSFLITSPNAGYVPEIIEGIVSVHLREDGTFGKHDAAVWPQVYDPAYPYLATIPKRMSPLAHASAASVHPPPWTLPSLDDFVCLPNTPIRAFGRFSSRILDIMEPLVLSMSTQALGYRPRQSDVDLTHLHRFEQDMTFAWRRLRTISATYRDQVVQLGSVRRFWLLCCAFMSYYDLLASPPHAKPPPANEQLMGAWTSDPNVAQKFYTLGIPIWLVRAAHVVSPDIRVAKFSAVTSTDGLCHDKFYGVDPIYQGVAGAGHLLATFSSATYADLSRIPTANISDHDDYCAASRAPTAYGGRASGLESGRRRSSRPRGVAKKDKTKRYSPYNALADDRSKYAHASQVRGRDKFIDVDHPWMPASLPSWTAAMRAVDRSTQAKPPAEIWGYWIPEPALLLGPKDPDRLQRYVLNWLRAQPVWLYVLQIRGSGAVKVVTQYWRNFLNGVPDDPNTFTKAGKRAFQIKQIFGRVFSEADLDPLAQGEVQWHQHRVAAVDDRLGRLIVWETFELGFRYELWALDRYMRILESPAEEAKRELRLGKVFPSGSLWVVPELPSENSWGLFAPVPNRRVNALNALRDVLKLWPRCPPPIKNATPLQIGDSVEAIERLEMWMALFYTQTFFDASGRAPIVPHCYPLN